jgi:putative endonuclease
MPSKPYYVYIMTTASNTVLYTGVTNNLLRRVYEHKNNMVGGFTKRYNVHKLVYFEAGEDIIAVIEREKQIKSWKRQKKLDLITESNPDWHDLYDEMKQGE